MSESKRSKRLGGEYKGTVPSTLLTDKTRKLMGQASQAVTLASHPDCPACRASRMHSKEERGKFHPDSGQGHSREHGSPVKASVPDFDPKESKASKSIP